jgi:hypothetical protein
LPENLKIYMEKWNSINLLEGLEKTRLSLSEKEILTFEDEIFNNLCSEYDAEHFWKYIQNCGLKFTDDFNEFLANWREDELNHTVGFKHLYSVLYEVSDREIEKRLAKRKINFEPLQAFLVDEFSITLLIAYDEIATTKVYREDRDFYRSFGFPPLEKWIMELVKDEARHFFACVHNIKKNHQQRISEVPRFLEQIKNWETSGNSYTGTFVLDHEGLQFSEAFVKHSLDITLRQFQ